MIFELLLLDLLMSFQSTNMKLNIRKNVNVEN